MTLEGRLKVLEQRVLPTPLTEKMLANMHKGADFDWATFEAVFLEQWNAMTPEQQDHYTREMEKQQAWLDALDR